MLAIGNELHDSFKGPVPSAGRAKLFKSMNALWVSCNWASGAMTDRLKATAFIQWVNAEWIRAVSVDVETL